jgi:hypothetical protein
MSAFSISNDKVSPKKEKLQITNSKMNSFWRVSIARSEEENRKKKLKSPDFYIWFSVSIHKSRRLIKDLYFLFRL